MTRPTGAPSHIKFTNANVAALPFAESGQFIVRDSALKNFFLVVGRSAKTFSYQVDRRHLGKRHTVRKAIGRSTDWDAGAARKEAKLRIGGLQTGHTKPNGQAVTLGDAWRSFRDQFKHQIDQGQRSAASLRSYQHSIENVLGDWKDAKLRDLSDGTAMVAAKHRAITAAGNPAMANVTMRALRIVYNFARKTRLERDLPPGLPTDAINWNPQARRETGMSQDQLAAWYKQLRAMGSPVREEFHLMMLLSGSRPDAMKKAKWEHLDVKGRVLHFPRMKGGSSFDIPLSRPMLYTLVRARRAGRMMYPRAARTYCFPGPGAEGCIADTTEARKRLSRWGGDLRQTFVNVTKLVGLSGYEARCLLNHAVGDVHDGYAGTTALNGLLIDAQKRVSQYIVEGLEK